MTAAILSGGENTRMPVLKGFLDVGGRTIIERSIYVLGKLFGRVVISTNMPEKYFRFGLPMIGDIIKERGPMTGILSVLAALEDDAVFTVACDMPFLNEELAGYMAGVFNGQAGKAQIDAVIPVFNRRPEPLFAIYARSSESVLEEETQRGRRGIQDVLPKLNVMYIREEEVRRIDPEGASFVNINTIEDYERIGGNLCLV